jgi:hypothetical protein
VAVTFAAMLSSLRLRLVYKERRSEGEGEETNRNTGPNNEYRTRPAKLDRAGSLFCDWAGLWSGNRVQAPKLRRPVGRPD